MPDRKFQDREGREWRLYLDYPTATRVREQTGVDLATVTDGKTSPIPTDPMLAIGVLWSVIEPEAVRREVTPEAFAQAMGVGALQEATIVLAEAMGDFFGSTAGGNLLLKVASATRERRSVALEALEAMIPSVIAKLPAVDSGDGPMSAPPSPA